MTKTVECGKVCLKAGDGKMLYHAGLNLYTPKAYLFLETEETDWVEVDASEVPVDEEELTAEQALEELMEVLT